MGLDRYRLVAQLGAGEDGIAYRGEAVDGSRPVEIRLLTAARANADRWPAFSRRLRLAAMLENASAVRVLELGLEHDPPFVALDWVEGRAPLAGFRDRLPLPVPDLLPIAQSLAEVLSAAHRIGLSHGRLGPWAFLGAAPQLIVDFTGARVQWHDDVSKDSPPAKTLRAPEGVDEDHGDPAADVYALGALLFWLRTGTTPEIESENKGKSTAHSTAAELDALIRQMIARDPADRPSAKLIEEQLWGLRRSQQAPDTSATIGAPSEVRNLVRTRVMGKASADLLAREAQAGLWLGKEQLLPDRLGRYRLLEKLGQGGMGAVYRAEDTADGRIVAIKVVRSDWAHEPPDLRRFQKEARLLAKIDSPFVTKLLEVNEDRGIHYLVLEFVAGKSLDKFRHEKGRLDEPTALAIMADIARGLADAHEVGIVHRDVKPENILLVNGGAGVSVDHSPLPTPRSAGTGPRVKLTDFGLARQLVESESLRLTEPGALIGTPLFMAPEQCAGNGQVDARADVYSMGATLFDLLAGRPPFLGDNPMVVLSKHCNEPPPALQKLNPEVSDGVCQIVEKALAKPPEARYANAAAMLRDLERVLRGEPTGIAAHPRLPECDPNEVYQYDWTFELESPPEQLWPHVSNTERLNRAVGLPAVQFTAKTDPQRGVRRFGQFRKAGMTASWEEHPFEWIEGRRIGVLREYTKGPFHWLVSIVELAPRVEGGTTLIHRVRIRPKGLIGRLVAAIEVGIKGKRAVERVYRRIDAAQRGLLGSGVVADPFENAGRLSGSRRRRLDHLLDVLVQRHIDSEVVEKLGDFVANASPQEVARIRPLALARRLGLDPMEVVSACLHGAREGLFILLWDILCPVCRIPSEVQETLRQLKEHGRCEVCNLDYQLDFANSVELIFRAHPEIRETELGVYCIGGPVHSPHVVAQVRVGAGERMDLDLSLGEGAYRLRGPQLPFSLDFRALPTGTLGRLDLSLLRGPGLDLPRILRTGNQVFALTNDHEQELVVRVERTAPREDALTAARATMLALFRLLFPDEVLSPGQLVSVATVTLLVTDLEGARDLYEKLGDARAFAQLHKHFRSLEERIRGEGGTMVKTVNEGVLAAFSEPVAAVRAALEMQTALATAKEAHSLRLRIGVHRGPAMATTFNDHLDYFGNTVRQLMQLLEAARGGQVVLTQEVAADPQVAMLVQNRKLQAEVIQPPLSEQPGGPLHRLTISAR